MSSRYHRLLIYDVTRPTKTDSMGPFKFPNNVHRKMTPTKLRLEMSSLSYPAGIEDGLLISNVKTLIK